MTDNTSATNPAIDDNHVIAERKQKLAAIRAATNGHAFPNDIRPEHHAAQLHAEYGEVTKEVLAANLSATKKVAGRIMLKRIMGKMAFATIQDATGQIQLYVTLEGVGEATIEAFKHYDLGDIIEAAGTMFKTKTGELSINC
ncbi:MAG: hypothetical protein HC782_02450 [Gammaproteobacteria bacterium]|nr:hypothetical protein [Gammaproteobacteria bacterium]